MIKLENISFSYNKKKEFIQDLSLEFKVGKSLLSLDQMEVEKVHFYI